MASPRLSRRTLSARNKSRASLCQFTFSDGRKCRTPRNAHHPYFCFSHARKESRAFAVEKLSDQMDYFFSARYLSANDLSAALGRLFPAVVRGDIKPRSARTLTYLAQTIVQSIHLAQHEYISTFGHDAWCDKIVEASNNNYDHINPPDPQPRQLSQPDSSIDPNRALTASAERAAAEPAAASS